LLDLADSRAKTSRTTTYAILISMLIHRLIGLSLALFASLAIALTALTLQPATAASASLSRSASTKPSDFPWKGHDPGCRIRLPIPGVLSYGHFTTCPPKRVLIVGDSLALTMGIELFLDEKDWGINIDNGALNGCGFVTGDKVELAGNYDAMNPHCDQEQAVWTADARNFKAQAIVVELGWWDSFQHMINGSITSLAQPQYDSMVEQQILDLIHGFRTASTAPIYFLSVPWMNPPALPNGQPEPAASAANHNEINDLIQSAVKSSKTVHFVDISPYITPSGQFETDVGGGVCRQSDGVHLYYKSPETVHYIQTECGKALQSGVLSLIRQDLAKK
jgi:hypothetical protein